MTNRGYRWYDAIPWWAFLVGVAGAAWAGMLALDLMFPRH